MIKAVFFDFDGTVMSHRTHSVPSSAFLALEKLKQKGICLILCTGRHRAELKDLSIPLPQFDYYLTNNGNIIEDQEGNFLDGISIDSTDLAYLLKLFNAKSCPLMLFDQHKYYLNCQNPIVKAAQDSISSPIPEFLAYDGKPIFQAIAFSDDQKLIAGIRKNCPHLRFNEWFKDTYDLIPANGSKAVAIQKTLDYLHLKKDEVIVVGDGANDLDMFALINYSIAMGNAIESIKKMATLVTDDIDEDGLYNAFVRIKLI